jgi:hypothetical protein
MDITPFNRSDGGDLDFGGFGPPQPARGSLDLGGGPKDVGVRRLSSARKAIGTSPSAGRLTGPRCLSRAQVPARPRARLPEKPRSTRQSVLLFVRLGQEGAGGLSKPASDGHIQPMTVDGDQSDD